MQPASERGRATLILPTMDVPVIPRPARSRRWPFGILAVAALRILNAIGLLFAAFELGRSPIAGVPLPVADLTVVRAGELILAVLTLIGVLGLLLFKRWGWVLTLVLVGVALAGDLIRSALGEPVYLSLLLHVVTAFYLNARSVKALARESLEHGEDTP